MDNPEGQVTYPIYIGRPGYLPAFGNMVVGSGREVSFYKNVKFVLSFSCEDEMGNTHYYRATISIPSTKDFCRDPWQVECVG